MKNIVISLRSAKNRRQHIEKEFQKHNVDFTFFDALTPDLAQSRAIDMKINNNEQTLSNGELACLMSHVSIWQKMISEGIPHLAIFEDDVYLGNDAEYLLNTSAWIHSKWNIIKTETVYNKVFLSGNIHQIIAGKRYIAQLKGENLGTGGYILSLHGAKLYLDYILSNKLRPLDELIFDKFISQNSEPVYQMIPALCIQEIILNENKTALLLPSSLIEERRNRMSSEKKSAIYKLKRESNRLVLQLKKSMFAKDLYFK